MEKQKLYNCFWNVAILKKVDRISKMKMDGETPGVVVVVVPTGRLTGITPYPTKGIQILDFASVRQVQY